MVKVYLITFQKEPFTFRDHPEPGNIFEKYNSLAFL